MTPTVTGFSNGSPGGTTIETDEDHRTCVAKLDNSTVVVGVEVFDLNRSQLKVSAKKYGVSNGEMAELVMNQIVLELEDEG